MELMKSSFFSTNFEYHGGIQNLEYEALYQGIILVTLLMRGNRQYNSSLVYGLILKEMYASIVFKDSRDKTGFHKLHVDVLGKLLAALGAEIFRFLIMHFT